MDSFLTGLAKDFHGTLIDPAHAGYDAARAVWNGAIDRRPSAVARVDSAGDVATVLRHARAAGRRVCVRGGGHSAPGHSCIDDAVVIDLGALRDVAVNAHRATARVGGGALWSDVDRATAAHGLATTGGLISHTGVGGLTLGGGIGWLMRKHGLAVDNLVGAEVVLADGRTVRASSDENPDLFWALRGGGGNFGVVTQFDFRLHPVRDVLAGMVMHPAARAVEMLRFFREQTALAPDELTALFAFLLAPPAPFIPPAFHGAPMAAIVLCWCGDPARGAEVLAPLRAFGPPVVDAIGEMPYVALQSMLDAGAPRGMRYYMKSAYYDALSDAAIDALAAAAQQSELALQSGAPAPAGRCGGARRRPCDPVRPSTGGVRAQRDCRLARRREQRRPHRLGAEGVRCGRPPRQRRRLCELSRRRRGGAHRVGVRRAELRAAAAAEISLRSRQRVPLQPEHPDGWIVIAAVRSGQTEQCSAVSKPDHRSCASIFCRRLEVA